MLRTFVYSLAALTAIAASGCSVVPLYKEPAGFSDTYLWHLTAAQNAPPLAQWRGQAAGTDRNAASAAR
jgi:hypothetical protein